MLTGCVGVDAAVRAAMPELVCWSHPAADWLHRHDHSCCSWPATAASSAAAECSGYSHQGLQGGPKQQAPGRQRTTAHPSICSQAWGGHPQQSTGFEGQPNSSSGTPRQAAPQGTVVQPAAAPAMALAPHVPGHWVQRHAAAAAADSSCRRGRSSSGHAAPVAVASLAGHLSRGCLSGGAPAGRLHHGSVAAQQRHSLAVWASAADCSTRAHQTHPGAAAAATAPLVNATGSPGTPAAAAVPAAAAGATEGVPGPEGASLESYGAYSYRLLVAYDGTAYSGWQLQPRAPTIQMYMEQVGSTLSRVLSCNSCVVPPLAGTVLHTLQVNSVCGSLPFIWLHGLCSPCIQCGCAKH